MIVYLLRRLLATIPTIFGVALILFLLLDVVGGDPSYQMVGRHATARQIEEVRHEYYFDRPLPVQFGIFLEQIITFDYGRSFSTRRRISEILSEGIEPSLSLAIPAFTITTILAVLIGLFVAYFRGTWWDKSIVIFCIFGMSVSVLAYILFGQYVFAFKLGWFPISGYETDWSQRWSFIALPALIWIVVGLGYDVRFYRTAILEEVNQDYVRTARAKGLPEIRVFLKHVLKNSMVPILTFMIIEIPLLILGSFVLESFFGIPGLGNTMIDAIHNSDFPVIRALTMLGALLFIFGSLVTDVLYTLVDPRVTLK
jgi:peptide/nickel transport system permease protein